MVAIASAAKLMKVSISVLLWRTGKRLLAISLSCDFLGFGVMKLGLYGFVSFIGAAGPGAEEAGEFVVALGDERNAVADLNAGEEVLNVTVAEADAAVRGVLADGVRLVGAVDAEALDVQTDPARAEGIVRAGADHDAGLVVGGIFQALRDLKFTGRAGADGRADGYVVNLDDAVAFEEGEFAIGEANDDAAGWLGFGWGLSLRGGDPGAEVEGGGEEQELEGVQGVEVDLAGWAVHLGSPCFCWPAWWVMAGERPCLAR
jgi:hypothetical protein